MNPRVQFFLRITSTIDDRTNKVRIGERKYIFPEERHSAGETILNYDGIGENKNWRNIIDDRKVQD